MLFSTSLWLKLSCTGPSPAPYRMPGTLPRRRRRRLAPFPLSLLSSALKLKLIAIFITPSQLQNQPRDLGWTQTAADLRSTATKLVDVQRGDRLLVAHPAHALRQELGDTELPDALAVLGAVAQRDGVRHHQLVQHRTLDVRHRLARQH